MNELALSVDSASHIQTSIREGVLTIIMARPEKLNGWTEQMIIALKESFLKAVKNDEVKAVVLTGSGRYFCAGVNLGGSLKLMHPATLRDKIAQYNKELFDMFLNFSKPILVAVNGPAIGASVTSAALCNGIIASEKATFSTPFYALGVTPEGCSSIQFPRIMNKKNFSRMIGEEGWIPKAEEALEIGLIQWLVPHEKLENESFKIARNWIEEGTKRKFLANSKREELLEVNAKESIDLANAFLAAPFLKAQFKFLWSKRKIIPSLLFMFLWLLRPFWSKLL